MMHEDPGVPIVRDPSPFGVVRQPPPFPRESRQETFTRCAHSCAASASSRLRCEVSDAMSSSIAEEYASQLSRVREWRDAMPLRTASAVAVRDSAALSHRASTAASEDLSSCIVLSSAGSSPRGGADEATFEEVAADWSASSPSPSTLIDDIASEYEVGRKGAGPPGLPAAGNKSLESIAASFAWKHDSAYSARPALRTPVPFTTAQHTLQ